MKKIIGVVLGLIIGIIFLVQMIKSGDPALIKPAKTVLHSILIVIGLLGVFFVVKICKN